MNTSFEDTSTECAICLEPLYPASAANDDNDGDGQHRVLTLACGHKWHTHCLVEQLETAQPNSSERLLFTGCQCAKCGQICHHPALENLTRTTDVLRNKVQQLVQEQLTLDAPQSWTSANAILDANERQKATRALVEEGLRKYAFYLCAHCKEPYFGGTVDCADEFRERDTAAERLCVACTPKSQVICHNPLQHRGHLVWKCRYCCQPATHLCYGTVHFCDDCHERNSRRVQEMQQLQRQPFRSKPSPPVLTPIPCVGKKCPFPKPPRQESNMQEETNPEYEEYHSNGPTFASEQVYGCACCVSSSWQRNNNHGPQEPGSANLLQNPSGQNQLAGWRHLSPGMKWVVEVSDFPVDAETTTNFVSSFQTCVMEQRIDLRNVLRDFCWQQDNRPVHNQPLGPLRFEASAKYTGRTDCPSVFCLKAFLLDETGHHVLKQWATPVLNTSPDAWEQATLSLEDFPWNRNPRYLAVVVLGKDSRFWQGLYGSKVAQISLRLLGSPDQVSYWMKDTNSVPIVQRQGQPVRRFLRQNHPEDGAEENATNRRGMAAARIHDLRPGHYGKLLWEGIVPIVCFFVLVWLLGA